MPPPLSQKAFSMLPSSRAEHTKKTIPASPLSVPWCRPWSVSPSPPVRHLPPGLRQSPSRLTCHNLLHCFQAQEIFVRHLIVLFGPNFHVSYATEAHPESRVVAALRNSTNLASSSAAVFVSLRCPWLTSPFHQVKPSFFRGLYPMVDCQVRLLAVTPSPSASHCPIAGGRGGRAHHHVPWSSVVFFHGSHHF